MAFGQTLTLADDGRSAGYATLAWPVVEGNSFLLEEYEGDEWRIIYEGGDRATTLSGLADGDYRFRLSADNGPPGPEFGLTVAHHPLSRAFGFFAAGAVMLAVLVVLLVVGTQRHEDGEGEPS
ncbi:hypothetical protein [Gimibacter soli]|uniref:Uncharacterized protein n=1 Tax=Gimibacter soli TaxID=3024400 RepID=A0AAE9XRY0_9PROT|nr:hypothetical protein [Gimibacter soli]WCL53860.1 hypothetical protein PH603_15080 [Gimibacter soli]